MIQPNFPSLLKTKTDSVLISELKELVAEEKRVTTEVLKHLLEVESRRLHLEMGFGSLFDFATRELGYSAGAAQRRIESMRLMRAIPEVEEKIRTGEISLSVAAQAQNFFKHEQKRRNEKVSVTEKREVVAMLMGTSSRECERKLAELSPTFAEPREQEKAVAGGKTLIQLLADEALMEKLETLKNLMAHKNYEGSYQKLFHELADIALKKLTSSGKISSPSRSPEASSVPAADSPSPRNGDVKSPLSASVPTPPRPSENCYSPAHLSKTPTSESAQKNLNGQKQKPSRYIPTSVKRQVWNRDQGRCQFVSPRTRRKCLSRHAVQTEHIHPFAWNGSSTDPENLQLLCASHNAWRARELGLLSKRKPPQE